MIRLLVIQAADCKVVLLDLDFPGYFTEFWGTKHITVPRHPRFTGHGFPREQPDEVDRDEVDPTQIFPKPGNGQAIPMKNCNRTASGQWFT